MSAGNLVRLLLLAVCLAMLSACLKNGSFFPSKTESPPVQEKDVSKAEASGSLDQPRVTDGLTLKTVHEPESLPVCDLFSRCPITKA